jgi:uncharacterized protein YbjQ (UPF0145 family)
MSDLHAAMAALAKHPEKGTRGTTSDLSIDEVLLLHNIGWEAVDVVFGVSWWSIPWGVWQYQTGEIAPAIAAFSGAMSQASQQLGEEATKAGGSGVVGVDIELRVHTHHIDIGLTGTAIRRLKAAKHQFEFVSGLSARDFALLARAGWLPLGLAAGASFVVAPRRSARQWASQQGQNTELPTLTEALYLAREGAMARMQESGHSMNADGVVGVKLREGPLTHSARIMQFIAAGTAVRLDGQHQTIDPSMVIPLDEVTRQFEASKLRAPS